MEVINKKGPYVKDDNSTFKIMHNLLIALIPIIIFTFYKNGYTPYNEGKTDINGLFYPLMFVAIPALTSFLSELLWSKFILKKDGQELVTYMKSSFSIFPGLFLGLILPINTPLLVVVLGSMFATIVGKLIYGGFGHNIFNPALTGGLFIISTYSLVIVNNGGYLNPSELDAVTTATPLSHIVEGIGSYNTLVKPYGNLWDFFIGTIPGSVGETSALLCLFGLIYLIVKKVIKPVIPIIYIGTVFVVTYAIGLINGLGIWYPLFQILSGGLMFGAIFMATDPVTSPVTKVGQIIYGLSLGLLTVVFRYLTPFPEGVMTSILTMNMLVFALDTIGFKARFKRLYGLIPFFMLFVITCLISIYIGFSFDKKASDFKIESKETKAGVTSYIVTTKGYSGTIKAKVEIVGNKVTKYEILEQNDSFYLNVKNSKYIDKLMTNQYKLENVDTVTGATVTSTAIKKLLMDVISDYTGGKGFTKENDNEEIEEEDTDFKVISQEEIESGTIYYISKVSFGGELKLAVTMNENMITTIYVLETNDSYFSQIYDSDYINQIIENQEDLANLDTVAGATISSTSLKEAIIKLLETIGDNNETDF